MSLAGSWALFRDCKYCDEKATFYMVLRDLDLLIGSGEMEIGNRRSTVLERPQSYSDGVRWSTVGKHVNLYSVF
jgi:hypothetical protein